MNKVDYLEKELSRLLEWVQAADTRVSLVLPLTTLMLSALAVLSPPIDKWTILSALTTSFSTLTLVASIGCLAFASFPRTKGIKGSMIFFSGIKDKDIKQFRDSVNAFDEKSYIDDLISQCHINAQIADAKFLWVKRSLVFLFLSSAPWILSINLLYGIR